MWFEIFVIIATILILFILKKSDHNIFKKFFITIIAVLLFEYLTSALWVNQDLEVWAYLYKGVSWIITLGWVSIILASVGIIDALFPRISERKKFIYQIVLISIVGFFAEIFVRSIGIREYSSLAQQALSGIMIINVPLEAFYYIPVFMALVLSFKRYWEISTLNQPKNRGKKK